MHRKLESAHEFVRTRTYTRKTIDLTRVSNGYSFGIDD